MKQLPEEFNNILNHYSQISNEDSLQNYHGAIQNRARCCWLQLLSYWTYCTSTCTKCWPVLLDTWVSNIQLVS